VLLPLGLGALVSRDWLIVAGIYALLVILSAILAVTLR
jgi:hypothetical protein